MRKGLSLLRMWLMLAVGAVALSGLSGCGYNQFQNLDEETKSAWQNVLNQYQRRADLIPNIVESVKGETDFEKSTLNDVIRARANATSIQMTPEMLNDPAAMQKFQQVQGQLSGSLSRLMLVVERYPDLKANQAFADLRVQLEGTENRIAVARDRYIEATKQYNILTRQFPTNLTAMIFGYETKAGFTVENEKAISAPPRVDFTPASQQ